VLRRRITLCSSESIVGRESQASVDHEGRKIDWSDAVQGEGRWFLQHAYQVKNIWVPYGSSLPKPMPEQKQPNR
jgi:hypothetical protein